MNTVEKALNKAVQYEAEGNYAIADFYLRLAERLETRMTTQRIADFVRAIDSAQRSVTGRIHY